MRGQRYKPLINLSWESLANCHLFATSWTGTHNLRITRLTPYTTAPHSHMTMETLNKSDILWDEKNITRLLWIWFSKYKQPLKKHSHASFSPCSINICGNSTECSYVWKWASSLEIVCACHLIHVTSFEYEKALIWSSVTLALFFARTWWSCSSSYIEKTSK